MLNPNREVVTRLPEIVRPGFSPSAKFRFLQIAARLLLEYNFRSELIKVKLEEVARRVELKVSVFIEYRGITLYGPEVGQFQAQVRELRTDMAVSAEVNRILDRFVTGKLSLAESTAALESVERDAPRHARWALALIFGLGAAALARLLRADPGAIAVSGTSAALGLLARQELAKRHVIFSLLPLVAAFVGAFLGGIVIRLGWTATPGFCLLVPALMLVPGPHLINAVYDMLENHVQTGLSRLGLAAVVLAAAALGIFLGGWLTLGLTTVDATPSNAMATTFGLEVLLAGVAACAFGAFYNAPWRVLWISIICGMVGHAMRFLRLYDGASLEAATLSACVAISLIACLAVERLQVPFAAVAFAGAVPMMPGAFIYRAIAGAMRISQTGRADSALLATTLSQFFKAGFVVAAMALGLLVGGRIGELVSTLARALCARITRTDSRALRHSARTIAPASPQAARPSPAGSSP